MLRVKLNGLLKQVAGLDTLTIPLPPSSRLRDALADLEFQHPGILGDSVEFQWRYGNSHVIVAVNGKQIEGDCELADGDEIALIPPLGGG